MKKIIIFGLFCVSFMILGCEDNAKPVKIADNGNDSGREIGSLYGECYSDETCDDGLECDIDNNICLKKSDGNNNEKNDSENDNTDTMPDESNENNDDSNTSSEQTDDNVDTNDDSNDNSGETSPCKPNPCVNVENSTGTCTPIDETRYSCWCKTNYTWDSSSKTCVKTQTPCNPNPCQNIQNSTGICTEQGTYNYSCGCETDYTWNNSQCIEETRIIECVGLPEHARWNKVSTITQHWDGTKYVPSQTGTYNETESTDECRFKCNENYTWQESSQICEANSRVVNCDGLPENAEWNKVATISQTWNGSEWVPSEIGNYNETPIPIYSSTECRFKCIDDYHWEDQKCISNTRNNITCILLPENAKWNYASEITQTWDGADWTPSEVGAYNTAYSNNECHFKCNDNYTWQESTQTCVAKQRTKQCTGLVENAEWNSVSQITQTWNGTEWLPSEVGIYKKLASKKRCYFKCSMGYVWKDSQCQKQAAGSVSLGGICTNQKKCYKDYSSGESDHTIDCSDTRNFGQDAYYAYLGFCLPQTLVLENNVVKDMNTGLQWKTSPSSSCSGSWRTPTPQELLTIVDNNIYKPALNRTYFSNIPTATDAYLWTSKNASWTQNSRFAFELYDGSITTLSKTTQADVDVLCVYGSNLPTPIFTTQTIGDDIIVRDSASGLMWQKTYAEDKGWNEALAYCETLEYAGYDDWRLPNKNELASLLNYDNYRPSSDFPDMPSITFISSSTYVEAPYYAWSVDFASGTIFNGVKKRTDNMGHSNVRCVRSDMCDENELWSGSECLDNPCWDNPCADDANSTKKCVLQSLTDYACECNSGFRWNGSECQDASTIIAFGNICTNQKKCYNDSSYMQNCPAEGANFFGQDAQYAAQGICVPSNLNIETIAEQNVVVDSGTGLMWQQTIPTSTKTWEKAVSYCSSLSYAGYDDWRLPSPAELHTIVDMDKTRFDANYFPDMSGYESKFWTSQEYKSDKSKAYYGTYGQYGTYRNSVEAKITANNVVCVRGNEFPRSVFVTKKESDDLVVMDSVTGFMWQKTIENSKCTWVNALKYCENLTYAGYSDWRLPNKNELASLLNYNKSEAPYSDFPDIESDYWFWSSTTSAGYSYSSYYSLAYGYRFALSTDGTNQKTNSDGYVRCVRNAD